MAVLDKVVLALGAVRVATHAAQLAQPRKAVARARQELVHIGLVPRVPEDAVPGPIEYAMLRERELHHAEIGAQVSTRFRDRSEQELSDLLCEGVEFGIAQ